MIGSRAIAPSPAALRVMQHLALAGSAGAVLGIEWHIHRITTQRKIIRDNARKIHSSASYRGPAAYRIDPDVGRAVAVSPMPVNEPLSSIPASDPEPPNPIEPTDSTERLPKTVQSGPSTDPGDDVLRERRFLQPVKPAYLSATSGKQRLRPNTYSQSAILVPMRLGQLLSEVNSMLPKPELVRTVRRGWVAEQISRWAAKLAELEDQHLVLRYLNRLPYDSTYNAKCMAAYLVERWLRTGNEEEWISMYSQLNAPDRRLPIAGVVVQRCLWKEETWSLAPVFLEMLARHGFTWLKIAMGSPRPTRQEQNPGYYCTAVIIREALKVNTPDDCRQLLHAATYSFQARPLQSTCDLLSKAYTEAENAQGRVAFEREILELYGMNLPSDTKDFDLNAHLATEMDALPGAPKDVLQGSRTTSEMSNLPQGTERPYLWHRTHGDDPAWTRLQERRQKKRQIQITRDAKLLAAGDKSQRQQAILLLQDIPFESWTIVEFDLCLRALFSLEQVQGARDIMLKMVDRGIYIDAYMRRWVRRWTRLDRRMKEAFETVFAENEKRRQAFYQEQMGAVRKPGALQKVSVQPLAKSGLNGGSSSVFTTTPKLSIDALFPTSRRDEQTSDHSLRGNSLSVGPNEDISHSSYTSSSFSSQPDHSLDRLGLSSLNSIKLESRQKESIGTGARLPSVSTKTSQQQTSDASPLQPSLSAFGVQKLSLSSLESLSDSSAQKQKKKRKGASAPSIFTDINPEATSDAPPSQLAQSTHDEQTISLPSSGLLTEPSRDKTKPINPHRKPLLSGRSHSGRSDDDLLLPRRGGSHASGSVGYGPENYDHHHSGLAVAQAV